MTDDEIRSPRTEISIIDVGVFDVVDLLVDEDNFRLEPSPDQPAAIKAMLQRQGVKLITLAQDILTNGLSRGEFIWLAPDTNPERQGKFVVCEGNRRITALKILREPGLAGSTVWAKQFRELGTTFSRNPIDKVRGVLYFSVEAARPDVYRRHTNAQDGKGLEDWNTFAQDRASQASGRRRNLSMVVMDHLKSTTLEELAESLGITHRTTNADRLLSTFSDVYASQLDIKIRNTRPYIDLGSKPQRAEDILWAIMRSSDIPVDKIKSVEQRVEILKGLIEEIDPSALVSLPESESPNEAAQATEAQRDRARQSGSEQEDGSDDDTRRTSGESQSDEFADSKPTEAKRRPNRDSLERKTLAPTDRTRTLKVVGPRLPGVYIECRTVDVAARRNAAAMLMRMFLELSCEAFLAHHSTPLPKDKKDKTDWSENGITLESKIATVLHVLDPGRTNRAFVDARNGLLAQEGYSHSTKNLHRAMHDRGHALDPNQIKLSWDRWYPLLRGIHDSIAGG